MSDTANTTLMDKLGFKPGESIFVEDTPGWYSEFANDNNLDLEPGLPATHAHIFCDTKATLTDFLDANDIMEIQDSLWLSWPQKSSGIKTDLKEQDIRNSLRVLGWEAGTITEIDDSWSGLKFIRANS